MSSDNDREDPSVKRRRIMQALGVATVSGLAGCGGGDGGDGADGGDGGDGDGADGGDGDDGDGDDGDGGDGGADLGERVPEPILVEYWSNLGGATAVVEGLAPVVIENLEATFDTTVEYVPQEFTTQINNIIEDKRTHHLAQWWHTSTPDRLDPFEMTRRYSIDWAGGNGRANPANYADCEYTHFAEAQARAPDDVKRQEMVTEAHSIASNTTMSIPNIPRPFQGASNPDFVDLGGVGESGFQRTSPHWYIQSAPVDGDTWVAHDLPTTMETTNFPVHDSSAVVAIWSHLVHSTLTEYDENYQLQNVLAKDVWFEDNAKRIGAELRDATFHDGTEITADDVKFTFEHMWGNPGQFPHGSAPPVTSIEALDDKQVEFNFEQPFPALTSRSWPRWGIFHSELWKERGAVEDPGGFSFDHDNIIGSGPFRVTDFQRNEFMSLAPHDGHPVHEPHGNVVLQAFRAESTAVEAFLAEEIHALNELSPGAYNRVGEEMPKAERVSKPGFLPYLIYPQWVWAPSKFEAFRESVGMALDRQLMVETGLQGADVDASTALFSTPLMPNHPWRPPEDRLRKLAPDASGDIEGARQILTDAGWGWDDNGNLRYPADADLEPIWEEGGTPDPAEFDCLTADGEFEPTRDVLSD